MNHKIIIIKNDKVKIMVAVTQKQIGYEKRIDAFILRIKKTKITQTEIALKAGFTKDTLSSALTFKRRMTEANMEKLEKALKELGV
jgi:hypothetical protein